MSKKNFSKDDLIEILIKKARGFYYSEEVYEYEKTQNKSKNDEKCINFSNNLDFFNLCDRESITSNSPGDKMNLNEKTDEKSQNLTLTKKKITTHYVPPDMFSIKTLLEILGEEVNENFEKMSDEQLLKLKEKLIGELKNEDN